MSLGWSNAVHAHLTHHHDAVSAIPTPAPVNMRLNAVGPPTRSRPPDGYPGHRTGRYRRAGFPVTAWGPAMVLRTAMLA
jgi:hypothetical protein